MTLSRSGPSGRIWREFQALFSEFTGLSVQAFDSRGAVIDPSPPLPSLCSFLRRQPETFVACQRDCFRKAATCRDSRRILAARCYAGLSYRVVPIRHRGKPHAVILVGRVLTEVLGEEQRRGFISRHRLDHKAFFENQAGLRSLGANDLERVASLVRTLAMSFVAADARIEHRHRLLARREGLLELAHKAVAFHDRCPGSLRGLAGSLATMFAGAGAAVLLPAEEGGGSEVLVSSGVGEESLHALARADWQRLFESQREVSLLVLSGREAMVMAGLDTPASALTVQRLSHGSWTVGYLALPGVALAGKDRGLLTAASEFLAARIVHQHCRDLAAQHEQQAELLGKLAERCLTARNVEEILPLALEAAMHGLRARRGSILLAEERGRITARALRGDHAPISGTIETLPPGSVSHRVFFDRRPLLVHDVDQEPQLKCVREFPYTSRSFVSVPLRDDGRSIGVMHVTEREGEGAFTPRDLAWLERLGLQASGAIRKIRLEQEVEELRVASTTDHLTGVRNRRYLEEQLAIELQRGQRFGQPLAVAMLDVDDFKALNDKMGHEFGDRVLKQVADVIRQQLRTVDVLARYGGDEFALILPGTDERGAAATAERVRMHVESAGLPEPFSYDRSITVSLGLAVCLEATESAKKLLQRADQALLQAKNSGRNTALLWQGMPA